MLESLDNYLHAGVVWLAGVKEEMEEAYEKVVEEEECGVEQSVAQLILLPLHLDYIYQLHFPSSDCLYPALARPLVVGNSYF